MNTTTKAILLKTNSKELTDKVFAYLADSIYDEEFENIAAAAEYILDQFEVEYNHTNTRRYHGGSSHNLVSGWLRGLPLDIDFYKGDILKTAANWHNLEGPEQFSDKQAETIVDGWFAFLAMMLLRLWSRHKLTITLN